MKEFKSQKIKQVIKILLKKKGITYEELAEQMECSVPTIKRILGPEELSLNRLLQLCEVLEIDLAELDALTQENSEKKEEFTEAQQSFLAKNKSHFAYLMKLLEGQTPKQIEETYGLTPRSTDKYLIALEKHNLIRVTGKQKVRPAFKTIPSLGKGHLAKVHVASLIRGGASFFISHINKALYSAPIEAEKIKAHFILQGLKISSETFNTWKVAHEKSLRELLKLSSYEEKMKPESELKTAVIMSAHTLVENKDEGLKILDHVMGEIVNLT